MDTQHDMAIFFPSTIAVTPSARRVCSALVHPFWTLVPRLGRLLYHFLPGC